MKKNSLILFFVLTFVYLNVFSAEMSIVDVHRNITLSDDDPVYKDFYINTGESAGLKKNLVVTAKRKIFVKDLNAKAMGDFETVVGQLRIIQVDGKMAVAREYKLFSRDEEPMLEQVGLMTGDRIDLSGSFIDTTKPSARKKVAEIEPEPKRVPAEAMPIPIPAAPVTPSVTPIVPPEI